MTTPLKVTPAHYTAADIELIARIEAWIESRNYTQAALARLGRISASSLNQILKGVYATSPTKLLVAIESAMRHADDTASNIIAPVETSVYKLVQTACIMARRHRNFAVVSAFVGTGKTFALKCYASAHPNTYLIEATPTMTPSSLLKTMSRAVTGDMGMGGPEDRFRRILDAVKGTDSLFIIDEAETLTPKQLHTLRRMRDLGNVGIVLAGTEHLSGLIKPAHGQFDQIRSRVGFWPATVSQISLEDTAALVQSAFGAEDIADPVIERLYAYARGSARMLVEGLIVSIREFRRDRALDVKLVDAVAKQALCLQPVV